MYIHVSANVTEIRGKPDDISHVRLGIGVISFYLNENFVREHPQPMVKPHNEYTIGECQDLLQELRQLINIRKVEA